MSTIDQNQTPSTQSETAADARAARGRDETQLAQASPAAAGGAPENTVTVTAPPAGERIEIQVQPGETILFQGVDLATAQIQQQEGGLLITLANGAVIFLAGFVDVAQSPNPPVIELTGLGREGLLGNEDFSGTPPTPETGETARISASDLLAAAQGQPLNIEPAAGPQGGDGGGARFASQSPGDIGEGLGREGLLGNEDFGRSPPEPEFGRGVEEAGISGPLVEGASGSVVEDELRAGSQLDPDSDPGETDPAVDPFDTAVEGSIGVGDGEVTGFAYSGALGPADPTVDNPGNFTINAADGSWTMVIDKSSGAYRFQLNGPLDHPNPDATFGDDVLSGVFTATVTNAAGSADAPITINVHDDAPYVLEQLDPISGSVQEDGLNAAVDEDPAGVSGDDLSTGNGGPDTADEDSGAAGALLALFGSGADAPLSFGIAGDTGDLPVLWSKGEMLNYSVSVDDNGTPGDASDDVHTLTAMAGGRTVFTLTVNGDGSWNFDLDDQLDHVDDGANDENFALVEGAGQEGSVGSIDFSSVVTAFDADGDSAPTLPAGSFTITVQDDIPVLAGDGDTSQEFPPTVSAYVVEDELALADGDLSDGLTDSDGDSDEADISGLGALVSPGADEDVTFSLDTGAIDGSGLVMTTGGTPVTSQGVDLKFAVAGDDVVGYADTDGSNTFNEGDREVFRLTDNGDGTFTFDLKDQVDHDIDDVSGSGDTATLDLDLSGLFVAEDFDGDQVSLPEGRVFVTVENDVPEVQVDGTETDLVLAGLDESEGTDRAAAGETADGNTDDAGPGLGQVTSAAGAIAAMFSSTGEVGADEEGTDTQGVALVLQDGTDSPVTSLATDLSVSDPDGLYTDDSITLVLDGGVVYGFVDGGTDPGADADLIAFQVELNGTDPATATLTVTQFLAVAHGDNALFDENLPLSLPEGALGIELTRTIVDEDGDVAMDSAVRDITGQISFDDDGPIADIVPNDDAALVLDETIGDDELASPDPSDIGFAILDGSTLFDASGSDAGSDGEASRVFALTLSAPGADSGLIDTETGESVFLFLKGGEIVARQGTDAADALSDGATVFTVSVDGATGDVEVHQYRALAHDDPTDPDEGESPEVMDGGLVSLQVTVTDGDGDAASASFELGQVIKFEDDGPVVTLNGDGEGDLSDFALNLDETVQPDGGSDPTYDTYNGVETESGGGASNGGADDVDTGGMDYNQTPVVATAPTSDQAIGSLTTSETGGLAILFGGVTPDFGSDGPAATDSVAIAFALALSGDLTALETNLVVTALDGTALDGLSEAARTIHLVADGSGGLLGVIGQDTGDAGDDYVALHITVVNSDSATDAQLQVEQFLPLEHGDTALFDEADTLMAAVEGQSVELSLTVTATDGDGDQASDTFAIDLIDSAGSPFSFDDDGPSLSASVNADGAVVHDESAGLQTLDDGDQSTATEDDNDNDVAGSSIAYDTTTVAALFDGVADKGDDPHVDPTDMDGDAIGYARGGESVLNVTADSIDFGTDGPGGTAYSFVDPDGADSGVDTTEGEDILLYLEDGVVVGRVGGEDGDAAFAIAINPDDGELFVAQYLSLQHPDSGDGTGGTHDEMVALTDESLQVVVTATDGDGDSVTSDAVNVGSQVGFEDDGPMAVDDVAEVNESQVSDFNVVIVFDRSGSMGDDPDGAGGFASRLALEKAAVADLLAAYENAGGTINVLIVDFASSASTSGWTTVAGANAYLAPLVASGNTNYEAATDLVQSAFPSGTPTADANILYYLTDGEPTTRDTDPGSDANPLDPDNLTGAEQAAWEAFLDANSMPSYGVGIGDGITESGLEPVAFPGDPIVVTTETELSDTLVETVPPANTVGGELLDGGTAANDEFGADGPDNVPIIQVVHYGDLTYTLADPTGGDADPSNDATVNGTMMTIPTELGGSLDLDFATGEYLYTAPSLDGNDDGVEVFTYTIADGDGDTSTADLTITVLANDAPTAVNDTVITNITDGSELIIPDAALVFNDTDPEGDPLVVHSVDSAVNGTLGLGAFALPYVSFTPSGAFPGADSGFSYTASDGQAESGPATVDVLGDTAGALEGTASADILLAGAGDDTLLGGAGGDVLIGGQGGDTMTGGADSDMYLWSVDDLYASPQIIMSTDFSNTLSGVAFEDDDLVAYDTANGSASLFFDGSAEFDSLPNSDGVNAVHLLDNGHIVLSTDSAATIGGVDIENEDLVDYDPVNGTANLIFDGSSVFDGNENLDAVHILDNGNIVLSTSNGATINGFSFDSGDLVEYNPTAGAVDGLGAGEARHYGGLGGAGGFSTLFSASENIDAVHILDNGHIILSTTGGATLGGLTFEDGDLVDYDPVAGTASLYFDEDNFDLGEDIGAVDVIEATPWVDTITDFDAGPGGDVLNFADVFAGGPGEDMSLADLEAGGYIAFDSSGNVGGDAGTNDTVISIDPDGAAGTDYASTAVVNVLDVTLSSADTNHVIV